MTDTKQPDALREGCWYMVNRFGEVTLCVDREDAEAEARKTDREWPRNGPHRAVRLVEASFEAADMAAAAAQGFRDGSASVAASAGKPVAWLYESLMPDGSVFTGASAERLQVGVDTPPGTIEKPLYLAAPPTAQAKKWMPIETAPKHESVLLYSGKFTPIYCGRKRHGLLGEPQQDVFAWRCDSSGRFAHPTHWMPLPLPPTSAEGEEHV